MKLIRYYILLAIIFFAACKEKSTDPPVQTDESSLVYSTSACASAMLGKQQATPIDSFCTYSFQEYLVIDFSVAGNCCPDSNRFLAQHEIRLDTILITVTDTARNLCRCNCTYFIHAKISGLTSNQYFVRCRLKNVYYLKDPIYAFTVYRNRIR